MLNRHVTMKTWIYCLLLSASAAMPAKAQVVEFDDPGLETAVRAALDKPEGDVTLEDLGTLTELTLDNALSGDVTLPEGFVNLTSLVVRYHSALTSLTLPNDMARLTGLALVQNKLTSLTIPEGLTSLTGLSLRENSRFTDLTLPEGLHNLTSISIERSESMKSLTLPKGLSSLTSLNLEYTDLRSLILSEDLPSLNRLTLVGGPITDYSFLDRMPNLATFQFSAYTITDYSFLEGRSSLTRIGIFGYDNEQMEFKFTLPEGLTSLTHLAISDGPIDAGDVGTALDSLALPEGMDYGGLEIEGLLDEEYGGTITFYRPLLRLRGGVFSDFGEFELTVTGPQGDFAVESTSDLEQWDEETQFTIPVWETRVAIPVEAMPEQMFFRLREIDPSP